MFDKNEVAQSGPGTIVGANVKLTGVLKDANDITIYGQIDGEVVSEKNVLIEEKASVKGPITATIVTVSGQVTGSINAQTKIEITPTGKINGSITTRDLIIKSGAQFDGKSAMIKDKNPKDKSEAVKEEVKKEEKLAQEEPANKEPKYEVE